MSTAFVTKQTEPGLWTVGHYDGDGKWHPSSDHGDADGAEAHAHYLNGGNPPAEPLEPITGHVEISDIEIRIAALQAACTARAGGPIAAESVVELASFFEGYLRGKDQRDQPNT